MHNTKLYTLIEVTEEKIMVNFPAPSLGAGDGEVRGGSFVGGYLLYQKHSPHSRTGVTLFIRTLLCRCVCVYDVAHGDDDDDARVQQFNNGRRHTSQINNTNG